MAQRVNGSFDWSHCRIFLAVLRSGSMLAAAEGLGESPATVRRRLERLEASLGSPLFTRSSDGVRPTPLADRLVRPAEEIEAAAGRMIRLAAEGAGSAVVRLAAEGMLGTHLLPAVLRRLWRTHPAIRFECWSSGSRSNPLRRDVDLALTWSRSSQESVVCTRVGALPHGVYASGDWLAGEHGEFDLDASVSSGSLLATGAELRLAGLDGGDGAEAPEPSPLHCDDESMILGAIGASLGPGILPELVGDADPRLGRVLPATLFDREVWLSMHPDLRRAPEIRATVDAVRRELDRQRR